MEGPSIKDYRDYAREHGVFDDEVPKTDTEMIIACNQHRQHYLLYEQNDGLGCNVDTRCHKQSYWNQDCDGFDTGLGSGSCPCNRFWCWDDDDFDPTDTEYFNIHSVMPYGRLRCCD